MKLSLAVSQWNIGHKHGANFEQHDSKKFKNLCKNRNNRNISSGYLRFFVENSAER